MGKYLDILDSLASQEVASDKANYGENRFGQPHAKLFPFLNRKVRTPSGPGLLIQVFADRVTVLLDSDLKKCSWFRPEEIGTI